MKWILALVLCAMSSPAIASGCRADLDDDGNFLNGGTPDEAVDVNDLLFFLAAFEAGNIAADISDDGGVEVNDLLAFLSDYVSGCGLYPDLILYADSGPAITMPGGRMLFVPGCDATLRISVRNAGKAAASGVIQVRSWLTPDLILGNGNDLDLGTRAFNLGTLNPTQSTVLTFSTNTLPSGPYPFNQNVIVRIDESNLFEEELERNNTAAAACFVGCPDVGVASISTPPSAISGNLVPVTLAVRNYGPCALSTPVTACIGPNCSTCNVTLAPYGTNTIQCNVLAPASDLNCGTPQTFSVTACTNFASASCAGDSDPSNNCATPASIELVDRHPDLAFTIPFGDASISRGGIANYTVRVKNEGDATSPQVCARTAICLSCGNYAQAQCIGGCGTPSVLLFMVAPLAPLDSRDYPFFVNVCVNAAPGLQRIQAGVDTFSGCSDCNTSNNNACRNITIN